MMIYKGKTELLSSNSFQTSEIMDYVCLSTQRLLECLLCVAVVSGLVLMWMGQKGQTEICTLVHCVFLLI